MYFISEITFFDNYCLNRVVSELGCVKSFNSTANIVLLNDVVQSPSFCQRFASFKFEMRMGIGTYVTNNQTNKICLFIAANKRRTGADLVHAVNFKSF